LYLVRRATARLHRRSQAQPNEPEPLPAKVATMNCAVRRRDDGWPAARQDL